jgi:hypothetical protein
VSRALEFQVCEGEKSVALDDGAELGAALAPSASTTGSERVYNMFEGIA